jgi:cation transport ATPase
MNQKFSFRRWRLLVAKHGAENKNRYLISLIALTGLLYMWFVFVMKTDQHHPLAPGLQEITFYFSLFLVGPFYATQFFKEIHSRTKGINYLMLPASSLEKLLCGLFYTLFIFFIAFHFGILRR